jgi:hypothetical protein
MTNWIKRLIFWLRGYRKVEPKQTPNIPNKHHQTRMPGRRNKKENAAGMQ